MTPFDPVALLAMLLTFYPVPSVAALQRARRDRPEYFAGGELVSTSGEKLRLPDERVFDLIFDVEGFSGGPRWQAIEVFPGGDVDPFPLEPGPLVPIDIDAELPPRLEPGFVALVSSHLGAIVQDAARVGVLAGELAAGGGGAEVDGIYASSAGDAGRALEGHIAAYSSLDPSDVIANTGGLTGQIDTARQDYTDPESLAPPDLPVNPEPREPPPNDGPGSPWYQQ